MLSDLNIITTIITTTITTTTGPQDIMPPADTPDSNISNSMVPLPDPLPLLLQVHLLAIHLLAMAVLLLPKRDTLLRL
ncbi:hypothetical protein EUX98_g995 [Antrodiella citrinella]|uniref:Uncharacterized protein n=1 Tax=Antrodiella citrinella TaxID=2447956 RepID=A0A4S4N5L1_9APHY|nr:hypothetical protein EUX98_g995 [Antrodiella citrinella]